MSITFTNESTFATRARMADVRPGDLMHVEAEEGDFYQLIVTTVTTKGKMVSIAAKASNPDLPEVPAVTPEQYRAMTADQRAEFIAARAALVAAARRANWSSTHRAGSTVAQALGKRVTVAYRKH